MTQGDNTIIPTSDLAQVENHKEDIEPQTSLQSAYSLSKGKVWKTATGANFLASAARYDSWERSTSSLSAAALSLNCTLIS